MPPQQIAGLLLAAFTPPTAPSTGELVWTAAVLALLAAALHLTGVGLARRSQRLRRTARGLALAGLIGDLGLLIVRDVVRRLACPLQDNFDSAILFVVMLGGVLFYLVALAGRQPAAGDGPKPQGRAIISLVLLPLMILIQLAALGSSFERFRSFDFAGAWPRVHLATLILAAVLLAAAAIAGALYLVLERALRRKASARLMGSLPSLERLAGLIHNAVLLGFILLSVSMVVGSLMLAMNKIHPARLAHWAKIYVSLAAWAVYLVVLGGRAAPRLRGRPIAWLSIIGFLLLMAAYGVAQWQKLPPV